MLPALDEPPGQLGNVYQHGSFVGHRRYFRIDVRKGDFGQFADYALLRDRSAFNRESGCGGVDRLALRRTCGLDSRWLHRICGHGEKRSKG
jgi:hypothetical protein